MTTKRTKKIKPVEPADPDTTVEPSPEEAAALATIPSADVAPINGVQLDAAILRLLRRYPNKTVDLAPLAEELRVDPYGMQLRVEDLARRRMVVVPFIEPSVAGGATITEVGLKWLIDREGGEPSDMPATLKIARGPVRAADEAARMPRAEVYGVSRGS